MFTYKTRGTCSVSIDLEIDENNTITHCRFNQGCKGNTAGLSRMVIGRDASEVRDLLRGIPCRGDTSCPDQLSHAIEALQQKRSAAQ